MFPQMVWEYINSTNDLTSERQFIASVIGSVSDRSLGLLRLCSAFCCSWRWSLSSGWAEWWQSAGAVRHINWRDTGWMLGVLGQVQTSPPAVRSDSELVFSESYREDFSLAQSLSQNQSDRWYRQMKSGAESGWDYSSRWFSGGADGSELYSVSTGDILPVDLNSFLCKNAQIIAELYRRLERLDIAKQYEDIRDNLKAAIRYSNGRQGNKTEKSSSTRGSRFCWQNVLLIMINISEQYCMMKRTWSGTQENMSFLDIDNPFFQLEISIIWQTPRSNCQFNSFPFHPHPHPYFIILVFKDPPLIKILLEIQRE